MMDKLRLETLAVRVVEWHNRHPLARRIGAQHVQSIGYVALPFRAGGAAAPAPVGDASAGASLRERAMARAGQPAAAPPPATAPGQPREAAFDEAFLGSISVARVARWAAQNAREITIEPSDGPVRRVAATGIGSTRAFYAMTALVEIGGQRSRVLVGAGEQPPVLGRRLWSLPRMAAVLGVVAVAAGLAWIWQNLPQQAAAPSTPPAASAASAAPSVAASAPSPLTPVARVAASPAPPAAVPQLAASAPVVAIPASAPTVLVAAPQPAPPAASAAAAPAPPLDVEPQLGRVTLPPLNLPGGDAARNAARARAGAPAASAASAAQPSVAAAPPGAPSFAVSTRVLRTRAESEQVMVAMQSLLTASGARGVRVEIVPAGADWRVVGWPFARRDEADRARALLASRGMRVEVVDF